MYSDDSTFEVIPAWQNKLQAMAYEDAIYTRNSHYAYEIKNNKMKPFITKMYCDDCTKTIKKIYKIQNLIQNERKMREAK